MLTVDTQIYKNLFDQAYNLPLYYEGQIKWTSGEAMLYVGQNPDDKTNETSAHWGTGRSNKYYALQIGNFINGGNIQDPSRSSWTKFSLYLDQNEMIFYQSEGIEKYRITKNAETISFWNGIETNNNSIKVGTKTWKKAEYRNLKVGHSNIWDVEQYRFTPITDWGGWNLGHENIIPSELVLSNKKTQTWQGCAAKCEAQLKPSFIFVTAMENLGDCSCYESKQLTTNNTTSDDIMTTYMVGTKDQSVSKNELYQCLSGACGTFMVQNHYFTEDFLYKSSAAYKTWVDTFHHKAVVVTINSKAKYGVIIPYNFTLEDEFEAKIPHILLTSIPPSFIKWDPSILQGIINNGYVINNYKHFFNTKYNIGDFFTLSYDGRKTVKKVKIRYTLSEFSVDVQIQVGGQTVIVAATTSNIIGPGGSSYGTSLQEAIF